MALAFLPTALLCDVSPEPIALLPHVRRLWHGATLAGRALRFPVFAAGVVPTPPRRELVGEVGVPIECAGRMVAPGDAVYADGDGVVIVPARIHDDLVARARIALESELAEATARISHARPAHA